MEARRIITHDGVFHADEVFAIALVHSFYGTIAFTRTRVLRMNEFEDPTIMILDQGGKFEPKKLNFDHHQNAELPATVMMMLQLLLEESLMSKEHFDVLVTPILAISQYDIEGGSAFNGFQVNELIKGYNVLSGDETQNFAIALVTAKNFIESRINMVDVEKPKSYETWLKGEVICHLIRVCERYPFYWKEYKEQPLLIYPIKGIWRLLSADTELFPISATGMEVSISPKLFVADYQTKEQALAAAKKSVISKSGLQGLH